MASDFFISFQIIITVHAFPNYLVYVRIAQSKQVLNYQCTENKQIQNFFKSMYRFDVFDFFKSDNTYTFFLFTY